MEDEKVDDILDKTVIHVNLVTTTKVGDML